jgi:hypothetical protein
MWYKYCRQVKFLKKAADFFEELKGEKNRSTLAFDLAAMLNYGLFSKGYDPGCQSL